MAKKGDYFGLSYIVSVILAIIPVTAWLCGIITRFSSGGNPPHYLRLLDRLAYRSDPDALPEAYSSYH